MDDSTFLALYYAIWWFIGGGFMLTMEAAGWVAAAGPLERVIWSIHGLALALFMDHVQGGLPDA